MAGKDHEHRNAGRVPESSDELLDSLLPVYTEAIEKIFGDDYDVSRFVTFLRVNVRQFLERASVVVYDAAVRGKVTDEHRQVDPALRKDLWDVAERCGLGRKAIEDMFRPVANGKERVAAERALVVALFARYFRHRDGTAVTPAEADAVIGAIEKEHRYEKAIASETKRIDEYSKKTNNSRTGSVGTCCKCSVFTVASISCLPGASSIRIRDFSPR